MIVKKRMKVQKNMNTVRVRNVVLGEGKPKICVPIVGVTKDEIIGAAKTMTGIPADIVEWRVDWFEYAFETEKVIQVLKELREVLGETPLLFTFRTAKEGGEKVIEPGKYVGLNKSAAATGYVDLIDVEAVSGDAAVKDMIEEAHRHRVKVIVSRHDFEKTPKQEDIISGLCKMQESGADITKMAVMPQSERDVLTLLLATEEMHRRYADRPMVTMSMAGMGMLSRLSGEIFGSALTFGSAGKVSAPGQVAVEKLDEILTLVHEIVSK